MRGVQRGSAPRRESPERTAPSLAGSGGGTPVAEVERMGYCLFGFYARGSGLRSERAALSWRGCMPNNLRRGGDT